MDRRRCKACSCVFFGSSLLVLTFFLVLGRARVSRWRRTARPWRVLSVQLVDCIFLCKRKSGKLQNKTLNTSKGERVFPNGSRSAQKCGIRLRPPIKSHNSFCKGLVGGVSNDPVTRKTEHLNGELMSCVCKSRAVSSAYSITNHALSSYIIP